MHRLNSLSVRPIQQCYEDKKNLDRTFLWQKTIRNTYACPPHRQAVVSLSKDLGTGTVPSLDILECIMYIKKKLYLYQPPIITTQQEIGACMVEPKGSRFFSQKPLAAGLRLCSS